MCGVFQKGLGLFQGFGDAARLLGSRCLGCGSLYFPRSLGCRNPACNDRRVEDAALPREGTLYSYTVQSYRPPGLFRMDEWAPYVLALVDLNGDAGGLRVMGMMTACRAEDLRIGPDIVKANVESYRKLRNTMRYILGAVDDLQDWEFVQAKDMPELDRYILHRLHELEGQLRAAYEVFDYKRLFALLTAPNSA